MAEFKEIDTLEKLLSERFPNIWQKLSQNPDTDSYRQIDRAYQLAHTGTSEEGSVDSLLREALPLVKKEYGLNNTEINSYEEAIVVHDILMKYKSQRAAKKAKRANSPPLEVHIAEVRPTGSHSVYGGIEFSDDPLKWHSKP